MTATFPPRVWPVFRASERDLISAAFPEVSLATASDDWRVRYIPFCYVRILRPAARVISHDACIQPIRTVQTQMTMTNDILVMGGGATGQLAAAYLRMRFPKLKVSVVLGPPKNRPIVGESLVEVSVDFMFELGLGAYLVEKHYPKYGLTYYFKPHIDDPADRTYVVDEIPTAPQILSFQINRFTFDREVRDRNVENGVELIDGTVMGVEIKGDEGLHTVTVEDPARGKQTLGARWLVDATGRNRVLAK